MNNKDVMLKITVTVTRDGSVATHSEAPNGTPNAPGVVALGMLDVAAMHIKAGFFVTPVTGAQA